MCKASEEGAFRREARSERPISDVHLAQVKFSSAMIDHVLRVHSFFVYISPNRTSLDPEIQVAAKCYVPSLIVKQPRASSRTRQDIDAPKRV
jgi:hypothetical protein